MERIAHGPIAMGARGSVARERGDLTHTRPYFAESASPSTGRARGTPRIGIAVAAESAAAT